MDHTFGVVVVVVEAVRHGSIDEGRPLGRHLLARCEHRRTGAATIEGPDSGDDRLTGVGPLVATDAVRDDVEDQLLGVIDHLCGQFLELEPEGVLGISFSDLHSTSPI